MANESPIRTKFAERFGEHNAQAIEYAAASHKNGIHDNTGSDAFRWALVICIGFECWTKPDYAKYHGIDADAAEIKQFIREHGDLANHDGDCDYLCLFTGDYNEYIPSFDKVL